MHDLYANLVSYLQQIWLYRLPSFLTAVIVCVVGWAYIYRMPDIYEAKALVYVDTESMLKPLLKGLAIDDTEIEEELMRVTRRSMLSRPSLRRVARDTDLDLTAKDEAQMERVLSGLARNIKLEAQSTGGRRRVENIVSISYRRADPKLANRVVTSFLDIFMEAVMGATRKDTDKSERFLDTQIQEYRAKLEAAEKALEDFKRSNAGFLPSEGQTYFAMVRTITSQLQEAELKVREALNRRDELSAQIAQAERSARATGVVSPVAPSATKAKVDELESRLSDLSLRYTDQHPDVAAMRRTLEEARARLEEELEHSGKTASPGNSTDAGVLQELRVELGKAEAEIAALRVRVEEYNTRLEELHKAIDVIPRVEADLARLNRDYDINKSQYDELVRRREAARLSRQADLTADESQFRIIEPPQVPLVPVSPDRPRLVTAVLALGLLAGAGVGFLISQIKPTFVSTKELRQVLQVPVWGRVSMLETLGTLRRRRLQVALYSTGLALLFAAYGYVLATHALEMDLVRVVKSLIWH
jgi:polysaccharide chain length determinant protein (PEP-CTERM system associated)